MICIVVEGCLCSVVDYSESLTRFKMKFFSLLLCFFPSQLLAQSLILTPGEESSAGIKTFIEGESILVSFDLNRSYTCSLIGVDSQSVLGIDGNWGRL